MTECPYDFSNYTIADICSELFSFIDEVNTSSIEQNIIEALKEQFYKKCREE